MKHGTILAWAVLVTMAVAAGEVRAGDDLAADDQNLKPGQMAMSVSVPQQVVNNRSANVAYYSAMPKGYASIRPTGSNRATVMNAAPKSAVPAVDPWQEIGDVARRRAADTGANSDSAQTAYLRNNALLDLLLTRDYVRTLDQRDVRMLNILGIRTLNIASYQR